MSSAPYMQLYVGDYLADTLHLTTEQHGAYLLLLMTMWRAGASLPNDPAKLARMARVSPKRWPGIWQEIAPFFIIADSAITQQRLTKEHQKVLSLSQERKTSGSKGGTAKALKDKEAEVANATILPQHSQISEPYREEKKEDDTAAAASVDLFHLAIPEKPPPLARIPSNWTLSDEGWAYARKQKIPDEVIEDEARGFHAYWTDRRGRDAAKSARGWEQCWEGRCRSIAPRYQSRSSMVGASKASGYGQRSSLASIAARRRAEGTV